MMNNHRYAPFYSRFIAVMIDSGLSFILFLYALSVAATATSLAQVVYILILFLLLLISPLMLLYQVIFIRFFGGTLGKLICGISIEDLHGHPLSLKRILFRQTIGYSFSWLFFGLGYLALIKNEKKQTWHDQVVGSVVVVKQPIWFVGLLVWLGIIALSGYLVMQTFQKAESNTAVQQETMTIVDQFKEMAESTESAAPSSSTTPVEKGFSKKVIDSQAEVYKLLNEKNYKEASTAADKMMAESKTDMEKALAYQVKGEIFISQDKFKEAKTPFLESLKLYKDLTYVHQGLAMVSIDEKNYSAARDYAQKATELDPTAASPFYWLGLSYFYMGNEEQALKNVEKAITLDPENTYYQEELASMKEQL